MLKQKASREHSLEEFRCSVVQALLERRWEPGTEVVDIIEFLELNTEHLTAIHKPTGWSLLHKYFGAATMRKLVDKGVGVHVSTLDSAHETPLCRLRYQRVSGRERHCFRAGFRVVLEATAIEANCYRRCEEALLVPNISWLTEALAGCHVHDTGLFFRHVNSVLFWMQASPSHILAFLRDSTATMCSLRQWQETSRS